MKVERFSFLSPVWDGPFSHLEIQLFQLPNRMKVGFMACYFIAVYNPYLKKRKYPACYQLERNKGLKSFLEGLRDEATSTRPDFSLF